jgi:5-methylcytosine-specific restriction enzyme A
VPAVGRRTAWRRSDQRSVKRPAILAAGEPQGSPVEPLFGRPGWVMRSRSGRPRSPPGQSISGLQTLGSRDKRLSNVTHVRHLQASCLRALTRERGFRIMPDRPNWYANSRAWRRRRKLQLREHPLCAYCLERGVTTPAAIADHIEPVAGDWNRFRLGRLQSLCTSCHASLKAFEENRGYRSDIGADGWPTDPRHPANRPR